MRLSSGWKVDRLADGRPFISIIQSGLNNLFLKDGQKQIGSCTYSTLE
jgi:hypothetical protein